MNRVGHTLSGVAAGLWTLPVAPVEGVAGSFVTGVWSRPRNRVPRLSVKRPPCSGASILF